MPGHLIILCGRSFSGKSTVASKLADAFNATTISLDDINAERGLWGGDGIPISEWAKTNTMARERTTGLLSRSQTVVIDDTNSPRFLRDGWRDLCKTSDAPYALVFVDTPVELIRDRLQDNRRTSHRQDVIDQVMDEHLDSFEPPDDDEDAIRLSSESWGLSNLIVDVRARWTARARKLQQ